MSRGQAQGQPEILSLDAIVALGAEAPDLGGKAGGLARLHAMGLAVPPAFVIRDALEGHYPQSLDQHYRHLFAGSPEPGRVAVRSSALGEDGAEMSFAGQYESILNVQGPQQLREAIDQCVRSLAAERAEAYKADRDAAATAAMCVVVQRMVDARAAGVLFSADPVSGRHDRMLIDAVAGLGESLVSGESSPDHFVLDRENRIVSRELAGDGQVIGDRTLGLLAEQARRAVSTLGEALDMEWAEDADGQLYWLQARPITTLGADLNELDTPVPADQVLTRCNVGEMMPGAVCPLTFDVQGRALEHAMQHMHVEYGGRAAITGEWTQINHFFGHLFINLSGSLQSARYVSINDAASVGQSLCGREIPELVEPANKAPLWRRYWGSLQFFRYCYRADAVIAGFERRARAFYLAYHNSSLAMVQELEAKFPFLCETAAVHLRSSATSGVMEGIVQRLVSQGRAQASADEQAEAARLLAGAEGVESAMMVEQLDEVIDLIAEIPGAEACFRAAQPAAALAWLESSKAGAAQAAYAIFLRHHGHRGYRELCIREPAWVDQQEGLVVTMQAALAARLNGDYRPRQLHRIDLASLPRSLRYLLPKAHNAIRRREYTKSLLADITHRLKRAYRYLGQLLVREELLDDADLVFFFTRDELSRFVRKPAAEAVSMARARRRALDFQQKLEFADIAVGCPQPLGMTPVPSGDDRVLAGRPVSQGVVEGYARVALTLRDAASLRPGEILVAPITDIGWTPYFSLIAGLATDVGSAVSHGAVIAREYGLPAIVNLRSATQRVRSGDWIRLDADHGLLTILQEEGQAEPAAAASHSAG